MGCYHSRRRHANDAEKQPLVAPPPYTTTADTTSVADEIWRWSNHQWIHHNGPRAVYPKAFGCTDVLHAIQLGDYYAVHVRTRLVLMKPYPDTAPPENLYCAIFASIYLAEMYYLLYTLPSTWGISDVIKDKMNC